MPSRNTYSYLPLNGSPVRQLDVDNEHDKKDILLAVDLCRIIVRALEISAFRDLQKRINDLPKNRFSEEDLHALFQHLSKLLFSLRGRLSWWAVVGISSSIYDDSRDEHIERVTELTKTLYFWYFVVKKKLPPWRGPTSKGVYNHYADTLGLVFDGFPEDESLGGFHAWMDHGRSLFSQASVHQPLPQPFPLYR